MKTLNDKQLDAVRMGLPTGDFTVTAVKRVSINTLVPDEMTTSYLSNDLGLGIKYQGIGVLRKGHPALRVFVECWDRQDNATHLFVITIRHMLNGYPRGGCWVHYISVRVVRQPHVVPGRRKPDVATRKSRLGDHSIGRNML